MKTSSTFRVDHRPLRHKHRGVWGGAIVPGVIVLGFYACMLLAMWQGDAARDARIKAVYVELQSRADQLVLATTMFVVAAGLTSVVFVYMLWRRVNQLQATLQPDAGLKV